MVHQATISLFCIRAAAETVVLVNCLFYTHRGSRFRFVRQNTARFGENVVVTLRPVHHYNSSRARRCQELTVATDRPHVTPVGSSS